MTELDTAADPGLRDRVVEEICALLPRVLKREVAGATADTTLMEALGLSSTAALELVLELEERLEREISVEDMGREDFATIGTLASYIAANLLPEED
ncbi:phosphopantetheine-binding protein [Actinocrinis sp.]|jgi:acyl carrier protein|uniref:phosphopantetheine-binding protein n=1 Tax=Actinocrinis sp. TaxID=1920516 RepID=UPI002CF7EE9A|nr:phosphopantetheine-binding protein [Actinocrinis sp.]HXR74040.1 phosphopantetheine-binding protein [Actinocrinis sp.]